MNVNRIGHWITFPFDIDKYFGFVYRITNVTNHKKYIGCKQFRLKRTKPPLPGRKNKRHYKKESNWQTYTGSSKELNADIERLGKQYFLFEILELHTTKWDMKYAELVTIIQYDAIRRDDFYNGYIGRIGRPPNKINDTNTKL